MNAFSKISTWMMGLRVATGQAVGFGVTLILTLLVGALGISGMARLNGQISEIVMINNAKLGLAQSQRQALSNQERDVLRLLIANDAKEKEELLNSIKFQSSQYDDAKAGIKEIMELSKPTEREAANLTAILAAEARTAPQLTKAIQMLEKNESNGAIKLMQTDLKQALGQWASDIDELVSTEQRLNDTAATTAQKQYILLRNSSLVCIGLALIFGIAVALLITRSLLKSLGGEPHDATMAANKIAAGDLALSLTLRPGDNQSIMAALATTMSQLSSILHSVHDTSKRINNGVGEIAQGNLDLSSRTERQASSLQEIAASMEQLKSTVAANADNVTKANQLGTNASKVAAMGGDIVAHVVETMNSINESSQKISEITSVIDSIAFQTNILALNAAIEAARAGEHGRGFAVVASEVRSLAGRSAGAAKEIKNLIHASVERVKEGTELANDAGTTMSDVVKSIRKVTDTVSMIKIASDEQATGATQICEAITDLDQVTQQNAALVEQISAASTDLQVEATDLVKAVSVFKFNVT